MKRYLLPLIFIVITIYSCKKVNDDNAYKQSLPSVTTGKSGYPTDYVVGDTLTINGRLFYDSGTLAIRIGNADAKIIAHTQSKNSYYGNSIVFDEVKMVITEQMGIGKNISVTIKVNGNVLNAPPINISKFIDISSSTDTTLFVKKLLTWTPADPTILKVFSTTRRRDILLPYLNGATVNPAGVISFFNSKGIFQITGGQVNPLLTAGQSFTENGSQFSINFVIGATNTNDPNIFYFSAEVLESDPSTATQFVYRLCKYDAVAKTVTTLNRSAVFVNPVGQTVSGAPYEGDAATVKLTATDLKMGPSDELYFINDYSIARDARGQDVSHSAGLLTQNQNVASTNNLCVYKTGKITSLIAAHSSDNTGFEAPGLLADRLFDYLISPDGNFVLTVNIPGALDPLAMYDLNQHGQLYSVGTRNFRFKSFDTDPTTTLSFKTRSFQFLLGTTSDNRFFLNGAILPNGEIVNKFTSALASFNYLVNTVYAYAGAEIALVTPPSTLVDEGKAKKVDFSDKNIFGIDKAANFYFWKKDASGSISFYEMYSKK